MSRMFYYLLYIKRSFGTPGKVTNLLFRSHRPITGSKTSGSARVRDQKNVSRSGSATVLPFWHNSRENHSRVNCSKAARKNSTKFDIIRYDTIRYDMVYLRALKS